MRWFFAAVLFALAVMLAIGTAALRSDNVRRRHDVELSYRDIEDRKMELRRLTVLRLETASVERLAQRHWDALDAAAARAAERLQ